MTSKIYLDRFSLRFMHDISTIAAPGSIFYKKKNGMKARVYPNPQRSNRKVTEVLR